MLKCSGEKNGKGVPGSVVIAPLETGKSRERLHEQQGGIPNRMFGATGTELNFPPYFDFSRFSVKAPHPFPTVAV
jgi:hypothetical protein